MKRDGFDDARLLALGVALLAPLAPLAALSGCRALQGDYLSEAVRATAESAPGPRIEVRDLAAEEKARYLEAHAAFGEWWRGQVEGNVWLERLESDDDVSGSWDADTLLTGPDGLPTAYIVHYYLADGGTGVLIKAAGSRSADGLWEWSAMGPPRKSEPPSAAKKNGRAM